LTESYNETAYVTNPSFIEARIDTQSVVSKIKNYLAGYTKFTTPEGEEKVIKIGESLCNDQGVYGIISAIEMRVNSQTVQGNFMRDDYEQYKFDTRRELVRSIVINAKRWDVRGSNIQKIVDDIMGLVIPFMSRLINNKERESYSQQFQSREVINQSEKGGVFNWGKGRNS